MEHMNKQITHLMERIHLDGDFMYFNTIQVLWITQPGFHETGKHLNLSAAMTKGDFHQTELSIGQIFIRQNLKVLFKKWSIRGLASSMLLHSHIIFAYALEN